MISNSNVERADITARLNSSSVTPIPNTKLDSLHTHPHALSFTHPEGKGFHTRSFKYHGLGGNIDLD